MINRTVLRREALRSLAEGARPTLQRLADASGLSLANLERRAKRECWALERAFSAEDLQERVRPIVGRLLDKVEAMSLKAADKDGRPDRTEIDGLLAMIRALDKLSEFTRSEEAATNKQTQDDEDLATILDRLNRRIVELARELAAQLVAQGSGDKGNREDAGRMDLSGASGTIPPPVDP